jgi:hypothetical protein
MRSVVLTTLVALWLATPAAAAGATQDPAPEAVQQRAVPRSERIRARDTEAAASDTGDSQRRGAVRAAPRAEPPTAAPASAPSNTAENRRRVTRTTAEPPALAAAEDPQQRRGAVRRPPSTPRGESAGGARTRDRAVPRTSAPPRDRDRDRDRDRVYVYPYPYRYGYGYGSYYDVYYNPWAYSGFGLGYYYSPWGAGPGYYGSGYGYRGYGYDEIGTVRLKVTPRDAEVWVDNYFAGYVDDFDGIFQSLKLEIGGHRIEIRKPGFAPLQFDVQVQPDRTVTFRGELRPAVP